MTKVLDLMRYLAACRPDALVVVKLNKKAFRDIDLHESWMLETGSLEVALDASTLSWSERQAAHKAKKRKR